MKTLKSRLDKEVLLRDSALELSYDKPDPLLVVKRYNNPYIALACALFSYGRAEAIVKFLESIDFSILEGSEESIRDYFKRHYYRFQSREDVCEFFISLYRLKKESEDIETIIYKAYIQNHNVIEGVNAIIEKLQSLNSYTSKGYRFLIGSPVSKTKGASALKRWMMYLRWMVRKDSLDLGLFTKIKTKDLIIPLDTHTHKVSLKLGLLKRKNYDLEAALELTATLKKWDKEDPIKYDFALYRIGQEKLLV